MLPGIIKSMNAPNNQPDREKARVLIVEDDEMVQTLLAAYMQNEGHSISTATSGAEMWAVLEREAVHLILLDLSLPDEDGLTLARQIRARSTVPIIVLTARLGKDDRIAALDIGVDDFLTKPCDPQELALRVRNVMARSQPGTDTTPRTQDVARFDGWTLDIRGFSLTDPQGRDVSLTPGEFNVLRALVGAPNRTLSRDYLLDATSRGEDAPTDRMIDVFISRLRKKIEANPKKPRFIVTVPGRGYKFSGTLS